MINIQIIDYIRGQLQIGNTKEKITSDLLENDWTNEDIAEAFASLTPQPPSPVPIVPPTPLPQTLSPQPTEQQPLTPQPSEPQPIQPEPIEQQPITPQPTEPQPTQPKPIDPQPLTPQSVETQPIESQIFSPQPSTFQSIPTQTFEPQPINPQPFTPPSFVPQSEPLTMQATPAQSSSKIIPIIISIVIILLLGGGAVFAFKVYKTDTVSENNNIINAPVNDIKKTSVFENPADSTAETQVSLTNTNSPSGSTDLWSIFDKMVLALKNKDIPALNAVSYTQIPADQEAQFIKVAPLLYDLESQIVKSEYINKWQDEKQAIYSTNPKKSEDTYGYNLSQGNIMFINIDGSWKVLLSGAESGWHIVKSGTNQTPAQAEQELQTMVLDTDKDGIKDQDETCTGAKELSPSCVKSDPNNRDTDGDGWWDGIEANMNR